MRRSSGRCSCRPRCACSVAGTGGCRPARAVRWPAACRASEAEVEAADPMTTRRTPTPARLLAALALVLVGCAAARPVAGRSWPTRPAARPSLAAADRAARRRRRSRPRRPATRRRPARPPDRVVVLHGPPARDGRRAGSASSTWSSAPSAARFPTSWVSHLAITDETGDRFLYSQRLEVGPQVDRSPRGPDGAPTGFDLSLTGADPSQPGDGRATAVGDGRRRRRTITSAATLAPDEAAAAGVAGRSRPGPAARRDQAAGAPRRATAGSTSGRPAARTTTRGPRWTRPGTLTLDGADARPSTASAWFDHQWGDFISVGGGGWDWFAVNLDDGTDLTLSLVRDADGSYPLDLRDGGRTPTARVRHLDRDAFTVDVTDRWTSPATGADYPAGWTIRIPGDDLDDRPRARRSPTRSSTRARRPGSSTGRARRSSARRAPGAARRRGLRRADGIRAVGDGTADARCRRTQRAAGAQCAAGRTTGGSSRSTVAASVRDADVDRGQPAQHGLASRRRSVGSRTRR